MSCSWDQSVQIRENLETAFQKYVIRHLLVLTVYDTLVLIRATLKEILDKYILKGQSLTQKYKFSRAFEIQ